MQFRIAAFAGFVTMGLVSTGVNAAPSPDPAELAEARAIIAIMFPPATRETTFATAQDNLILPIR